MVKGCFTAVKDALFLRNCNTAFSQGPDGHIRLRGTGAYNAFCTEHFIFGIENLGGKPG